MIIVVGSFWLLPKSTKKMSAIVLVVISLGNRLVSFNFRYSGFSLLHLVLQNILLDILLRVPC